MVTCLPTRTSVLGVTNPRGAFNPAAAHTGTATNISSPLLSRFDVVLVLSDVHEPTWDAIVSGHVLSNHQTGAGGDGSGEAPVPGWPVDVLRAYVAWARAHGAAQVRRLGVRGPRMRRSCSAPGPYTQLHCLPALLLICCPPRHMSISLLDFPSP
jgi:DNA replicative helicase MCM subunit Mcm2 (Cdc46/Mcm family)